jgi:hypothetical protein
LKVSIKKNRIFLKKQILFPAVNPLGCLLLLFLLAEFVSKILIINNVGFVRVSAIPKVLLQILIAFYVVRKHELIDKRFLGSLFLLFFLFILGLISLNEKRISLELIIEGIQVFNWYVYIYVLFMGFSIIQQTLKEYRYLLQGLFFTFELIFIINLVCVMLGVLFSIDYFKTYRGDNRFGFNGLFLHASHSSYIYIIYICYFYFNTITYKKKEILLCLALIFSLIVGTKTIYFFLIILGIYTFFRLKIYLNMLCSLTIVFMFSFLLLFKNQILEVLKVHFHLFFSIYEDSGLITMLFSYRNLSIENDFIPYIMNNWSFLNYFFGGAEFLKARTELSIIDFFWFFGFIGTFIYFYMYYEFILKEIISKSFVRLLILLIFFVSIFAGSFFSNVPVTIYFFVLVVFFKHISFVR